MKLTIGNPVKGDDFFDREAEQKRLWRQLETDNVLMLAPRRIGKTSLIFRLCETAQQHGSYAVYCSFAGCDSERDCVHALFKALHALQTTGQKNAEFFARIKSIKVGVVGFEWHSDAADNWRQAGEEIAKALSASADNWLVCVDELPVFVVKLLQQGEEGRQRARTFLYWLRDLRQTNFERVRWLMAGSVGLDTVAARLRIADAINDLPPFPLDAFSDDCARRFLDELAASYAMPLSIEVRDHMVVSIGWPVPYYLQLLFSQLRDAFDDGGQPPDIASVDAAFEKLLGPGYRGHFDYWRQRLDDELGQPEAGHATRLLARICCDRDGLDSTALGLILRDAMADDNERERALRYLLNVLESDGYLARRGERYAFRLEWLRRFWQREYAA
ncbi:MAG: hypothetical protein HY777_12145 [Betaproteobacteria bacterium]|nr:hypothetical protein [Betaproteobacteria bacterium]